MHRITRIGLIAVVLIAIVQPTQADLLLTVSEDSLSTANLNALNPGDQVTFDVTLSGVASGQAIGSLTATLNFDASLLGEPLAIAAGSIVPNSTDFFTSPGLGVADASFIVLFTSDAPITSNGVFFQFTVVAQNASGTGSIFFVPNTVTASDNDSVLPIPIPIDAGPALPFQVVSSMTTVPEPSSLIVVGFVGALIGIRQGRLWFLRFRTMESG